MDTSGFYKLDASGLLWAQNEVSAPGYTLVREDHEKYSYPHDGWSWFDSREDACAAFGVEDPEKKGDFER